MIEFGDQVERLLEGPRPLPLVLAGDPVLRTPAAPYDFSLPGPLWSELLAAMRQTMHSAPGVGLAAPQIGLGIRVAVLEDPALVPPEIAVERDRFPVGFRVLVNPSYESADAAGGMPTASFYEGCLSVPGYQAVVTRSASVRLRCSDENGHAVDDTVNGWAARIVAHEIDHLDGVLYLDRALTRSLATSGNIAELYAGRPMTEIRAALGF
jgi:peptide deformylase